MDEIEKRIIDLLLGESDITDVFTQRIYYRKAPQGDLPFPYAVLNKLSLTPVYSMEGETCGLSSCHLQIDIYAKTGTVANSGARAIRSILSGFRDTSADVKIQSILLIDQTDMPPETSQIERVMQEYRVWFNE